MGIAWCGARQPTRIPRETSILPAVLLLSLCLSAPATAQPADQEWLRFPERKGVKTRKSVAIVPPLPIRRPGMPAAIAAAASTSATNSAPPPASVPTTAAPAQAAEKPAPLGTKQLDPNRASDWLDVGTLELRGGNLSGAEASFERAIALGSKGGKPEKIVAAQAMARTSMIHRTKHRFRSTDARGAAAFGGDVKDSLSASDRDLLKAKQSLEQALTLNKDIDRKEGIASDYAMLGDIYLAGGAPDKAKTMFEDALTINKSLQRKEQMADNYSDLAKLYQNQGNEFERAEPMLKEALAINEALGLKPKAADNYKGLGDFSLQRGQPEEAEELYKKAIELGDDRSKISPMRALAELYKNLGEPGKAQQMEGEARALDKARGGGGRILLNFDLGLFVSGVTTKEQGETLEKLVPIEKALGHELGLATSYTLLGLHYTYRADRRDDDGKAEAPTKDDVELVNRAVTSFRDAVALTRKLGRDEYTAYIYGELAKIADKRGDLNEVETILNDALALHKKLGRENEMAEIYAGLGRARLIRNDNVNACEYWRKGALADPTDKRLLESLNSSICAKTQ
jgi:tetratricopeptide (TPR) repeat protein